jgi:hypothetical protein
MSSTPTRSRGGTEVTTTAFTDRRELAATGQARNLATTRLAADGLTVATDR